MKWENILCLSLGVKTNKSVERSITARLEIFFRWVFFVINMIMKTVLIIDKTKPRQKIIEDITKEAKLNGYKKDTIYRRLKGVKTLANNEQFYFMVRKIVKSELNKIDEIMVMKTETFEKYMNM